MIVITITFYTVLCILGYATIAFIIHPFIHHSKTAHYWENEITIVAAVFWPVWPIVWLIYKIGEKLLALHDTISDYVIARIKSKE